MNNTKPKQIELNGKETIDKYSFEDTETIIIHRHYRNAETFPYKLNEQVMFEENLYTIVHTGLLNCACEIKGRALVLERCLKV